MIGAADRYLEMMFDLAFERELAGGQLPEELEAERIDALDRCWRRMTEEEREASERAWDAWRNLPSAPDSLELEDGIVARGDHRVPRTVAA